ncbi:uncharacterized protein LOC136076285 [Hydra vulgaris]|uniref:Uncharacterized protein LOC136076285 n=1 Tax=Hydra vulgaris TaxID=6087 RepID=A0ABM4BA96_HYDVU
MLHQDDAIKILDNKYQKRSTAIMMRNKLRSFKQKEGESIESFMSNLKQFSRKCPTEPQTAYQHSNLLICGAFIAGIRSPFIHQRLLEATNDNLESLYKTALTMELATEDALNLTTTVTATTTLPTFAASHNLTKSPCFWCAVVKEYNEKDDNTIISTVIAAIDSPYRLVNVTINENLTYALLDTGSDKTFITSKLFRQWKFSYDTQSTSKVLLADNSTLKVKGIFHGSLLLAREKLKLQFLVVDDLVAPVIIGMDVLTCHSSITINFKGNKEPLKFCLATKMSRSPWRAQCFVVSTGNKNRLVIDYSNTINLHTPLDSYPTPRIDDLILKIAVHKIFSTIDLKSAYHQVRIRPEDYKLTAFEANGKLYEFKRLPFKCTNAVPIFQRVMDEFIQDNKLENTYAYLDDIIIGGKDAQKHDKNLSRFLHAKIAIISTR